MSVMKKLVGKCPHCWRIGEAIEAQTTDPSKPETKYKCEQGHTWYDWPLP